MSTLSVVHYNSSSPHKLNVLQTQSTNNDRREIIILRKAPQSLQQKEIASGKPQHDILITNTARKRPKSSSSGKETGRNHNPPPVAVARRNARERNRVKQVNNGFATLRQHIPNFIASAFETNNGRGGNKKLSKVETLRMAVEYIRSLEDLLGMEECGEVSSENASSSSICASSLHSPSPTSPAFTTKTTMSYTYPLTSPSMTEDDDLSNTNPTPPPHQYIRMSGSNAYQIIPAHLYETAVDNLQHIDVNGHHILTDPELLDTDFSGVQDLSLLSTVHTSDSLSPGMYSDDSLSPTGTNVVSVKSEPQTGYIQVFNRHLSLPQEELKAIRIDGVGDVKMEPPVLSLEEEAELPSEHKENMIDVIAWWEQQQNTNNS